MAVKDVVGRYGEDVAARRVTDLGWEVVARNWRCSFGELDLVAVDGDQAVFIEVKTRTTEMFGGAVAAVTPVKVRRLRMLAGEWLATQSRAFAAVRIDVVAVTVPRTGGLTVEHLQDVG